MANNVNSCKEDKSTEKELELIFLLIKKHFRIGRQKSYLMNKRCFVVACEWEKVFDNKLFLKIMYFL